MGEGEKSSSSVAPIRAAEKASPLVQRRLVLKYKLLYAFQYGQLARMDNLSGLRYEGPIVEKTTTPRLRRATFGYIVENLRPE